MLAPSVAKDSSIRSPELANTVSPSEAPPILGAVTSQRINIKGPKAGTRPEKRPRRVRGKGKGKGRGSVPEALQEDMENVPPPAIRQNAHPRRRRARGSGRVDIGIGPAPSRGRVTNSVGGGETVQAVNDVTGRDAEADVKTVDVDGRVRVNRTRKHGRKPSDTNIGAKRQKNVRRLPSQETARKNFESGQDAASLEILEIPKADRLNHVNAADRRPSEEKFRRSVPGPLTTTKEENATVSSSSSPREEAAFPRRPTADAEGDTSSLQPLPSSTRRRAKEYFQRRTRERSVDATRRQIRPARSSATVTEQGIPSNVLVARSELDPDEGAVAKASGKASGTGVTLSDEKLDHFAFDPVTSPFTPNATSSPKQASPSYIAVRSFSSPTPLPSHGNGKVAPLLVPKTSNRSNQWLATGTDSVPQSLPTTSHGIQSGLGLAYTYAGAVPAQAQHLQVEAEQMALMRLQAYYNWLAGSTPITAVGIGPSACEHMEMSGGAGGLSGGVALGRQGQSQGRGKGQCRNSSGAYAHPKEHVVFSPGDHEQTEVASRSVMQPDGRQGQTGLVKHGREEPRKEPEEGEARRIVPKWDGKWGLREAAASGKEIGWSWGSTGRAV